MKDASARRIISVYIFLLMQIVSLGCLLPSCFSKKYNKYVRYGFMLLLIREVLFFYDIEENKEEMDTEKWLLISTFILFFCISGLFFHLFCFNTQEVGHRVFAILYINLIFGSFIVRVFEVEIFQSKLSLWITYFIFT